MFQRDGADLHCEMPISFATAALGGEIEIPTLDGHAKIKIPAETQTGQMFRLRNKGIRPVRGSVVGDLYCHVAVETPVKLTARQKELLREFEAINQQDPAAHSPSRRRSSTSSRNSSASDPRSAARAPRARRAGIDADDREWSRWPKIDARMAPTIRAAVATFRATASAGSLLSAAP